MGCGGTLADILIPNKDLQALLTDLKGSAASVIAGHKDLPSHIFELQVLCKAKRFRTNIA